MTGRAVSRWTDAISAVILGALLVVGCAGGDTTTSASLSFVGDPMSLDEIGCDGLLADEEVNDVMDAVLIPLGRRASSCYWSSSNELVQLVVQTGGTVASWRSELLSAFTQPVEGHGFEIWVEPGSGSVAAFGPERGLIVHGAGSEANAIRLLRLALSRL